MGVVQMKTSRKVTDESNKCKKSGQAYGLQEKTDEKRLQTKKHRAQKKRFSM
jgi:hypothetical protein